MSCDKDILSVWRVALILSHKQKRLIGDLGDLAHLTN